MTTDFSWLPSELELVALRIARADELAFEIGKLSLEWSYSDGDGPLEVAQVEDPPGHLSLIVQRVKPIPPAIALLFGEAINHLRAAIDNTVFFLVEQTQGVLEEKLARRVAMPIYEDPDKLTNWFRENGRKGLSALDGDAPLSQRIKALQPFESDDTVGSISDSLSFLMGTVATLGHPLLLLQGYSNEDKHRSVRIAAARTMVQRYDQPFWGSDRSMRPIAVGDVLASTPLGKLVEVESNAAVHVERPDRTTWVAPARELDHLRAYVANVVIPMLVKGLEIPNSLPPQIDLRDTGQTMHQRIESGSWKSAHERMADLSVERLSEAFDHPPAIPPIVRQDPETRRDS